LRSAVANSAEEAIALPATDPLNFTGRIGGGTRVPALPGQMIHLVDGRLVGLEPVAVTPALLET
jgi:hypothetical protein